MPEEKLTAVEGLWELDLWNGAASFSAWFHRKLQWPADVRRKRLDDLKPNLAPGAWEALLQGIRAHLERQAPLELTIEVRLPDGVSECWQVQGAVELANYLLEVLRARDPEPRVAFIGLSAVIRQCADAMPQKNDQKFWIGSTI